MTLGERLRRQRKQRGISLYALSEAIGASVSHLASIERGDKRPSVRLLETLARYYGVSTDYLLEGLLTPDEAAKRLGYSPRVIEAAKRAESIIDAAQRAFPKWLVDAERGLSRSPETPTLPPNAFPVGPTVPIPIVGVIRAGEPILAAQNIEGYSQVPAGEVQGGDHFYLRVKGDSMIGARIHDGDLVLIRRQEDVDDGDIAVVLVDDEEATLKRVYRDNGRWLLKPENPAMRPIVVDKRDVRIIGKAIQVKFEL